MFRFVPLFAIALAASPLALSAANAAEKQETTTSQSRCYWVGRHYDAMVCDSVYDSPYSTTKSQCGYGSNSACSTTTTFKKQPEPPAPPKPYKPPSVERSWRGPLVIRGTSPE
jgi:hypothetical protein